MPNMSTVPIFLVLIIACCIRLSCQQNVDECQKQNGIGCGANAVCISGKDSFMCTCDTGFTGNGYTCTDVDECKVNNGGCSTNADCTNTVGSFTCTCHTGFTGDGHTCTDIDECAVNNGGCSTDAVCAQTERNVTCTCRTGFTGDGETCLDVNECQTSNGGCSTNADCTNTVGSFTCKCRTGFNGNGKICSHKKATVESCWKQYLKLKAMGKHRKEKKLSKQCIHKLCKKVKKFRKKHPMKCSRRNKTI